MWSELLPKMVGGTLTDHDAPNAPTRIIGYDLTDKWVEVRGEAFNFGAAREYIGIRAGGSGSLLLHTPFGMGATVQMPDAQQAVPAVVTQGADHHEPTTRVKSSVEA